MKFLPQILTILFSALFVRTFLWHLQNWQLREYRWDRLKAYFSTKEGRKNLWNLWLFRGILPRPKFTGRVILIMIITLALLVLDYYCDHYFAQICTADTWWCKFSRDLLASISTGKSSFMKGFVGVIGWQVYSAESCYLAKGLYKTAGENFQKSQVPDFRNPRMVPVRTLKILDSPRLISSDFGKFPREI